MTLVSQRGAFLSHLHTLTDKVSAPLSEVGSSFPVSKHRSLKSCTTRFGYDLPSVLQGSLPHY